MEYFHLQAGHLRIPQSSSNGCYDPIRRVVTLGDACFADFHCNDLPNTYCKYDSTMPRYNSSCQCVPNNKPFNANKRTGLVEGCSKLTKEDRYTVLGCSTRFEVLSEVSYPREFKNFSYTVIKISLYVNIILY